MKRNFLPFTLLFFMLCIPALYSAAQHPEIGGYTVYYGHLHNHTGVSDGTGTPDQAYSYAKNTAGLDFFSLSDHSEMMNSSEWTTIKNAANTYNLDGFFTTFYGFEWSSVTYGHVSVFNTDDYCSYLSSSTDNFSELLTWVNARSGIAFFNHPGWAWWAFQEFNKFTNTPSAKFVGMELWNDVDAFSKYYYNDGFYSNDGKKSYFDEALARGWKIGAAGSDDNHVSTWGTRTPWRVAVLANNLNRTEILNAIIARRFFSTLDNNLALSITVNGAQMGATTTGGNVNMMIEASDADGEIFSKVQLIKNGAVLQTWTPYITHPVISQNITCVNGDYFYIKVSQASDGDEAITSPVFIQGTANTAPLVSITNPANNASFGLGVPVNISASASDADGTIAKVEFYQNATKIGEDLVSPFEYVWTPAAAGIYQLTAKATDNLGASTVSSPVSVTITAVEPPVNITLEKRISLGSDDAEQYSIGIVVLNHTVLNIVYESRTTGNQTIGLRFTGLTLPKGITITKAYIEFTADKASSGSGIFTIYGEAADNPTTFTTALKNISLRKKTVASAAWTAGTWTTAGIYQSAELKTIVQEIVNRTGWTSGNNMSFIITGTGTRTAKSYDGASAAAPKLHIEYTTAAGLAMQKSAVIPGGEITQNVGLQLYPNPVHGILTVGLNGAGNTEKILIYALNGSLVKEIMVSKSATEVQVDCSSFVPGTYLLKLNSSAGSYSAKFIKQ